MAKVCRVPTLSIAERVQLVGILDRTPHPEVRKWALDTLERAGASAVNVAHWMITIQRIRRTNR